MINPMSKIPKPVFVSKSVLPNQSKNSFVSNMDMTSKPGTKRMKIRLPKAIKNRPKRIPLNIKNIVIHQHKYKSNTRYKLLIK